MTDGSPCARLDRHGRVAVLTIDNPPVNALSQPVRAAIVGAVAEVNGDDALDALVIAGAGRSFSAGADIREFDLPFKEPHLPDVVELLDGSAKPIVAAIHGATLGGGLELALACQYRIATKDARFGMPEVKLGLLPGARGTQHLPRLVGMEKALEMIAFGNPISAREASSIGLVDALAEQNLADEALAFAASVVGKPATPLRDRPGPVLDESVIEAFRKKHARKLKGLAAPQAIIRAIRAAAELPYGEAGKLERELFLELRSGPQSAALRHAFLAERATARLPELKGVAPRPVETVGIIGAGTMGTGIALCFLFAGMPVTLIEQAPEALARGVATIERTIEDGVASGRMPAAKAGAARALLTASLDYASLAHVDLVIEAAFETMEVKRAIFARLKDIARPGAILASNTSFLDIDALGEAGGRPADTLGLHFFSPAHIMKLLEIVRGRETAPDVLATGLVIAKRIGKVPVVSGNAHGFIGNRMLAVRHHEAEAMIGEGASPYAIDRVIEDFGFPMGPFRMVDLAGLDLGWSAETSSGATIRERLCEAGRRGQKSGKGMYDYDEKRRASPSPEVEALIERFSQDRGIARRPFTDEEIFARLMWPMIDEGAKLLGEGIARSADDIDVVWIYGYGWPAHTGGPMFYAAQFGWEKVAAALRAIGREPSPALLRLADVGSGATVGAIHPIG